MFNRTVRSRVIDPEAVDACLELISGMEKDIVDLMANDKVDRAIMHAEMDTRKAEVALQKSMEQLTADNWFQTRKDAKKKKEMAKYAERGEDIPEDLLQNNEADKPFAKEKGKGKQQQQQDKRGKKRGADGVEAGNKKKKPKKGDDNDDEPEDDGKFARVAARGYKAAVKRGEINERAEHAKMKASIKKAKKQKKQGNETFLQKMKQIENENLRTGKKRSKNQFKSTKRYKRR